MVEPIQVWKNVAPMIRHHHEMCDGSGYPEGLSGEQIPMGSRIIGVVEAFDAMTNPDSYSKNRSPAEALAELELHSGTRYDQRVVGALKEVLDLEEESTPHSRPESVTPSSRRTVHGAGCRRS
jgi:HD-GYP domain-containing protein (c-di-GMP phosphodiesterase class II)